MRKHLLVAFSTGSGVIAILCGISEVDQAPWKKGFGLNCGTIAGLR